MDDIHMNFIPDCMHIAIIGMAFRFPGGVHDESGMWEMLENGKHGIARISADRWPVDELQHADRAEPGRSVTFSAGVLSDIDQFDAAFFGISPREAAWLDPQQRLLLEMAYESMEDAGVNPASLAGSRCGVYVGISALDYGQHALEDLASMSAYTMTGNTLSVAANRLSYVFDLRGPSMAVDTACSSSLVALHQACQALRCGEIPAALVGGVNLLMHPYSFIGFSHASMLSAKGRCRPFDAAADGYVRAEGGAVLLLKPFRQALKDGDLVHAVVLASGVNADGARKSGLTMPSVAAQAELMRDVLAGSGLCAGDIDFIEAHGTGTPAGDPVEAASIGQIYGRGRTSPMPISSVKANFGHLEPASGMAGLVKAVLSLKKGVLPPMSLDFTPNPRIDFSGLNVLCAASGMPLRQKRQNALTAAVNSFGFGGVNAHVILQAAPPSAACDGSKADSLPPLLLSARSDEALRSLAAAFADHLDNLGDDAYDAVAYTAAFHRARLEKRLIIAEDAVAAIPPALRSFAQGATPAAVLTENALPAESGIAFIYTGNGAQWTGMGRNLYAESAAFREIMADLARRMQPRMNFSLTEALLEDEPENLADTTISQPLLFAVQVGLTLLLRTYGIRPQAVAGHSVGEIAAAWAAGALSLEQAIQVIHARSRTQGRTRGTGRMAAAGLSDTAAEALIREMNPAGQLEIAGINSPGNVTLSGDLEALLKVEEHLRQKNIFFRLLDLDYAFHSNRMDVIRDALLQKLGDLTPSQTTDAIFVSTVSGSALEGHALDSAYWWKNVRRPVNFASAVKELAAFGFRIFVEIGPHAILQRYIRENLAAAGVKGRIFPTLLRGDDGADRVARLAARLHALTEKTDLRALFPQKGRRVRLPLYPWQKQRCWYPRTSECRTAQKRGHPLLGWPLDAVEPAWENILDPAKDSRLADHKVGDAIVFPGAGYAEMALAAARAWLGREHVALESLDITTPLVFEYGRAQCVRCSLNSGDGSISIVSRPRLGTGEWVQHARARAISPEKGELPVAALPYAMPEDCREMEGSALYALTERLGLDYGPAFRVVKLIRAAGSGFEAILRPVKAESEYVLPPAILDACFHSLAVFQAGQDDEEPFAFLPVRTGRIERCASGSIRRIRGNARRSGRRSMSADFELLDATGGVVARALGCRFRAMPLAHAEKNHVQAWSIRPRLAPLHDDAPSPVPPLEVLSDIASQTAASIHAEREIWFKQILPLMEAVTLSAAAQAFQSVTEENAPGSRHASDQYSRRLHCLLRSEGVLTMRDGEWVFSAENALPPVEELWREAFRLAPQSLPALLPLGRVSRHLREVLSGRTGKKALLEEVRNAPVAGESRQQDPVWLGVDAALHGIMRHLAQNWPAHRRLRVLEVAAFPGSLTELLETSLPADHFEHVLAVTDDALRPQVKARYEHHPAVSIASLDAAQWNFEEQGAWRQHFDVIILRQALHKTADCSRALERTRGLLAPGGILLLAERHPDWSADFVEGLDPSWWRPALEMRPEQPVSALLSPDAWQHILEANGFGNCLVWREPAAENLNEGAYLLLASSPAVVRHPPDPEPEPSSWLLLADAASWSLAEALRARLEARGQRVVCSRDEDSFPVAEADHVLFMRGYEDSPHTVAATLDCLRRCIRSCAARESVPPRLWIMTCGGALGAYQPDDQPTRPAQCAVAGFGRVAMNEHSELRCTLVDVPAPEACSGLVARLEKEFLAPDGNAEILLTPRGRYTLRLQADSGLDMQAARGERRRLDFSVPGRLGNLRWQPDAARPPADDAVEVRVMATGLNFRDVMLAMGLLPDDAVENGFAGPNLGLEFAGSITRVGADVHNLRIGDRVAGFGSACFAGHVTTPAHTVARIPESWTPEAAATIPTVFFTAWYALKHLARLQPGERLLIHGAAGGVGLAAIQIARHLGVNIFATAGSEEKRDFLHLLGVEHVFDSRSLSFADDVLAATDGHGVDAVLNSLAGEAMRRSIGLLKPFGRFLELGKRDFVENTALGLRPFKENISYFAIDVDQLLTACPETAATLFQEVMRLLEAGVLRPLPYRAFPASRVAAAFRTMQQAQHIGKIVVTAEETADARSTSAPANETDISGAWLVTGGLSGFGLATARHLAERGVKHLVLAGRRGASTPGIERTLQECSALGVNVRVEACDMSDADAVRALVARIADAAPPLSGVVHAAAVFDDRFLTGLDRQSLEKVLAPKLSGAWHLHEATLELPLKHFVLFSSVSVALGNPGQANYVAANAGLEGLARLRISMGLPALCIAWGPVGDTGYLTRHENVKKSLAQHLGRAPLTSEEAMRSLDSVLPHNGLRIFANVDWKNIPRMLSGGASRFSLVARDAGQREETTSSGDIRRLLSEKSAEEGAQLIRRLIAEEVAQVLGLSVEQIALDRSVQSMGLDSLMAVELATGLEQRIGVRLSAMMLQDSPTVEQIAERVLARLSGDAREENADNAMLTELARRHAENLTENEVSDIMRHSSGEGGR